MICFGPGPQFKGGISNYNTSLAKALEKEEAEVKIISWTQQYPAIIPRDFIDRSSKHNLLDNTKIEVQYLTNYNNPFSWRKTYKTIVAWKPDMVIFQWAIALQGLPLGFIAKWLKSHSDIEVIFDLHVVTQKEASSIDNFFARFGLNHVNTYIAHAHQTAEELKKLFPQKKWNLNRSKQKDAPNIITLFHPVYDMFQPNKNFDIELEKSKLKLQKHVFLFFGFIRKYKGLHHVIAAFALLAKKRNDVSLLIAGESFWNTLDNNNWSTRIKKILFNSAKNIFLKNQDNEQDYNPLELINSLGIQNQVSVVNEFIPNEEVHRYFQVADCVVNFYETATPSGVESIAYNFNMPILATRVGHFPETIIDGYNGYLAQPNHIEDMCAVMQKFLNSPINRNHVKEKTAQLSWANYAKAILK